MLVANHEVNGMNSVIFIYSYTIQHGMLYMGKVYSDLALLTQLAIIFGCFLTRLFTVVL